MDEYIHLSKHVHFLEQELKAKIATKDVVFLVAGLGGETGSLVSQYIAQLVKELGILCVGLFSFPFSFEGRSKRLRSQQAYLSLRKNIDALLCIDNDRFLDSNLKSRSVGSINEIFDDSNNHFDAVILGLLDLLLRPGVINVDFVDIKVVLQNMGLSTVGYSLQQGEQRAEVAVVKLLESTALQQYDVSKAQGCLINIKAGLDIRLDEFATVGKAVESFIDDNATVVIGTSIHPEMIDEIEVTAILAGLPELPIDKELENNDFDIVNLTKSITFEAHQASAGLSILSYFNDFLHQKYSGLEAKISIEQDGNKVTLIVQTASGDVEKVEKSLHEFGLVVIGEKSPSDVLESNLDVERLQMKLEMAAMELKHNQKLLQLYQNESSDYKSRLISLEAQISDMQHVICTSLTRSQNNLELQLSNYGDIPNSLLQLLEKNINKDLSNTVRQEIEHEVRKYVTKPKQVLSLKRLAENALYGVAGNSLYSLIMSILATLPR